MFGFIFGILIGLHVLISIGLIVVVLLQSGKGGGLSGVLGGGGGGNSFMGTRGAADFLGKATTWFAVLFFVSCFTLAILSGHRTEDTSNISIIKATQDEMPISPIKPLQPAPE